MSMKISFSTVGCPHWSWSDIQAAASDLGYQGIEVRGIGEDLFLPDIKIFREENWAKACESLKKHNLTIACLAADVYLHEKDRDVEQDLAKYLALAKGLGVPGIRVLGDSWGWPGENVDTALVEARLKALAPAAEKAGVGLWVETNGVYADTARLKALLETVSSPAVQAVWDIHHPFRYFGESVETTVANIGPYIRHVHLKDADMTDGKITYKMLGYGSLPVLETLKALKALDYDGYLSMEWVKRWNEGLEDAGIAFPHFIYQVRNMLQRV